VLHDVFHASRHVYSFAGAAVPAAEATAGVDNREQAALAHNNHGSLQELLDKKQSVEDFHTADSANELQGQETFAQTVELEPAFLISINKIQNYNNSN
jgi:hypothetical protein